MTITQCDVFVFMVCQTRLNSHLTSYFAAHPFLVFLTLRMVANGLSRGIRRNKSARGTDHSPAFHAGKAMRSEESRQGRQNTLV